MNAMTISVVLLWLAVLALGLRLWALSRHGGVLVGRVAPVRALGRDEAAQLRVVLASDGEADHLQFMREQGLQAMPYLLSTELGMGYRVSRLPYAVLIDREGVVKAKGLVNSREQLDSLLNAQDMGT